MLLDLLVFPEDNIDLGSQNPGPLSISQKERTIYQQYCQPYLDGQEWASQPYCSAAYIKPVSDSISNMELSSKNKSGLIEMLLLLKNVYNIVCFAGCIMSQALSLVANKRRALNVAAFSLVHFLDALAATIIDSLTSKLHFP
jgi:hypothetical protein